MLPNNKKIVWCLKSDVCLFWVHNLTQNKVSIVSNDNFEIYFSKLHDVYFYYSKINEQKIQEILQSLNYLVNELNNDVHCILSDFQSIKEFLKLLNVESQKNEKINFSIINIFGETIYDTEPLDITSLNNIKNYFSCCDLLNKDLQISHLQNKKIFYKDYKYPLIYFYYKLGFNFIQRGEHIFVNCNRINKVFLYTKSKPNSEREKLINLAIKSDRIFSKEFDETDDFWFDLNTKNSHIPFLIDYNICKFNLIMETQPLTDYENNLSRYITEKTLKALMVPTPSYIPMQIDVYNELVSYGFYFLNQEFGEYNYENYKNFCDFLSKSDEKTFDDLYIKSFNMSYKNKITLESYIFSEKTKEINLLWN